MRPAITVNVQIWPEIKQIRPPLVYYIACSLRFVQDNFFQFDFQNFLAMKIRCSFFSINFSSQLSFHNRIRTSEVRVQMSPSTSRESFSSVSGLLLALWSTCTSRLSRGLNILASTIITALKEITILTENFEGR